MIARMIPHDKALHCIGGTVLYAAGHAAGLLVAGNSLVGCAAGMALCLVVANGKEIYDACHPQTHTADCLDALATLLGGLLGAFCSLPLHFCL